MEELATLFRKNVIGHQPGSMDKEDARKMLITMQRLVVVVDKEPGISDAGTGEFR